MLKHTLLCIKNNKLLFIMLIELYSLVIIRGTVPYIIDNRRSGVVLRLRLDNINKEEKSCRSIDRISLLRKAIVRQTKNSGSNGLDNPVRPTLFLLQYNRISFLYFITRVLYNANCTMLIISIALSQVTYRSLLWTLNCIILR